MRSSLPDVWLGYGLPFDRFCHRNGRLGHEHIDSTGLGCLDT